ncbi:MAG TPA: BTAD domain-containing putative transcriptional regulator [Acidimicrobiales bacterium]|jgi:DNA-binding SARP family transcriptional activator/tetratricopeptide (TPR) repeat protein|nr:BTAD domain-containing putative transcriptional regulator [Acidimicrobiales bacterium]
MAMADGHESGGAPDFGDAALQIRVLGPVEVSWNGAVVDIGGLKARALLSRLLIDRNLTVTVDRLLDSLWTDHDGEGAEISLRSTVSRLRKRLRDAGVEDELIITRAPGYVMQVEAESIDVVRFERLVTEGRNRLAGHDPVGAVSSLQTAEALWCGMAYSEVRDEPFARAEARRLDELRLVAVETRLDAEIGLGRHSNLVGELEALTSAHPMRERLWTQRMLALYRAGRQAEALRVFQELRTILVAELGIEPGHDPTWLEQAILSQSPDLDWEPDPTIASPQTGGHWSSTPPPPLAYHSSTPTTDTDGLLIGRQREITIMEDWWASARREESRLIVIDGDAGIGKTRLVSELARSAEAGGALVLWGRCDEDPVAPFQPFAEALGRYFQSLSVAEITEMPAWCLEELSRMVLRLRDFSSPPESETTDPDNDRFRFFGAVTTTLTALAERRPVLLVLDDLHWANQPTVLLLRHLLRTREGTSPGIVALFRDGDVGADNPLRSVLADQRSDHTVVRIHLEGLTAETVKELVAATSGDNDDLAAQLFVLTEGNPLFLDEIFRQLSYTAEQSGDGPDETPVPPNLNTPEAVKELVARRVSRLPDEVIHFLHAASVAGPEFEANIVALASELSPDQRLDAVDRAVESRLIRQVGEMNERYAFSHALVRDAIYGELLRGRRVRYHHKIAVATERVHADSVAAYVNELAHHFSMGAALADADKALRYSYAAGESALRNLAFEEAVAHFSRGLEVAELYGDLDMPARCEALLALAEAQNKAGDGTSADASYEKAAALARTMGDPERLALAALRAGPLSYIGIVGANADQVRLLEEARSMLDPEDSHLRAMVTARLGLVMVYADGVPGEEVRERALSLSTDAVAMARRLGDRAALGYTLNARLHALWGIDPAPERLAVGTELGQIADDVGDELLALHGHMWRVRELLAQGDIDAVTDEVERFEARAIGPRHPLASSYACNVRAMMALVAGDFAEGERLAPMAMELAEDYNEMAMSFYGALMVWTWWQQDKFPELEEIFSQVLNPAPTDYPVVAATMSLLNAELGRKDQARAELDRLAALGWESIGDDQTEGVSLTMTVAACAAIGAKDHAAALYEQMRPYAGTAIVIRAPAAACFGPADHYLGLLAMTMGDVTLAEVHFETALRLARRMRSAPFVAMSELELARALQLGGRNDDKERIVALLRNAEEEGRRMGLARIARRAAESS